MKNKTFAMLAVVFLAACSGKKEASPPDEAVAAFKALHPDAVITQWKDESPIWEAKYTEGITKGAVSFDQNAKVTETELVLPESELPALVVVKGYITANYPGEKIQRCEKIQKVGGELTYEIQITGKELVFDSTGNFLAEEPD